MDFALKFHYVEKDFTQKSFFYLLLIRKIIFENEIMMMMEGREAL